MLVNQIHFLVKTMAHTRKKTLGDVVGLSQFGVHLERLPSGS